MTPSDTALVVVDVQERLLATMADRVDLLSAIEKLVRSAAVLKIPTLVTLQYVKGLGPVCAELGAITTGLPQFEKLTFSCCGSDDFTQSINKLNRKRIILCGVETHVCIQQTALDLVAAGHTVYITADAVLSRREYDREIAITRMRDAGVIITTVESAVFELVAEAGTSQFKEILPIFR
jgi:nicotinamidase-related amidase